MATARESQDRVLLAGLSQRLSEEINANVMLRRDNIRLQAEIALRDATIHLHEKTISEMTTRTAQPPDNIAKVHPLENRKRPRRSSDSNLMQPHEQAMYEFALKFETSQSQYKMETIAGKSPKAVMIKQEAGTCHSSNDEITSPSAVDGERLLNGKAMLNQSDALPKRSYACKQCSKKLSTPEGLVAHVSIVHDFHVQCPHCLNRLPGMSTLRKHMKKIHNIP